MNRGSNYVFLGESGSGKTELSVNWALRLAAEEAERVRLFDMDQTKGLFRARDLAGTLAAAGVETAEGFSFQDAPVVPQGVAEAARSGGAACVFDVGGNAAGARMIGQFAEAFQAGNTRYCYVINPCRPFSRSWEDLWSNLERFAAAGRTDPAGLILVSNPCMGEETDEAVVLERHRWLEAVLAAHGRRLSCLTAQARLVPALAERVSCPVFPLQIFVKKLYAF